MAKTNTGKIVPCNEFLTSFLNRKLIQLYMVFGTEEYHKDKTVNMIVDRAIPADNRDFDFTIHYGDDMSAYNAIAEFSISPFIAERKVILIRKFDSLKAAEQQKIIDEFTKVDVENVLVLTAERFDNRLKISKQILLLGEVIQCKSPYKAEDMLPWLNEAAKGYGKVFNRQAALLFVNKLELDFNHAANELEKLALYCHDKKSIDITDVQLCTGESKSHNIFDFINSVGDKDIRQSFIIMENLLSNNEAPVFIISMLIRFFVQLWRINGLRAKNLPDMQISSSHLNDIHYMFRNNYLRYANNYPLSKLPELFSLLMETDTELKSVNLDESLIVERMLFRLFAKL